MQKFYFALCMLSMLGGAINAQNSERRTTIWDGKSWSTGIPDKYSDAIVLKDLIMVNKY